MRRSPWHAVRVALAIPLVLASACDRPDAVEAKRRDVAPVEPLRPAVLSPPGSSTSVWLHAAENGLASIEKLEADPHDRSAYVALRRAALTSMFVWRRALPLSSEGAFGPEVVCDDAGGSLSTLDRALTLGDDALAVHSIGQLRSAFALARAEIERRGISDGQAAQALSDSVFVLGQALSESSSFVPDGDDAAFADVLGLLDAVEFGGGAIGLVTPESPELRELAPIREATNLLGVHSRLVLIRATGGLGDSLRKRAVSRGLSVHPPYVAHSGTPFVSALTLPRPSVSPDEKLAALGERLFADVRLSAKKQRSCSTCHVEHLAYTDGLPVPKSLDPKQPLLRNTPTLLFAPVEARLMWDGRTRTADLQARQVIHTAAEMGQTDNELLSVLQTDPVYVAGFRQALGHEPTVEDIGRALAAYESKVLLPEDAPLDRFARGELKSLPPLEVRGFDLFAGAGRCTRCHVPPVFGGTRPPDFSAPIFAILGVPTAPDAGVIDSDLGRWNATHLERDRYAFRTPTVRNVARTAPYFHNGQWKTLAAVVSFYDEGGGEGGGLHVPLQDRDVRKLHLSDDDKRALLAFMTGALSNRLK